MKCMKRVNGMIAIILNAETTCTFNQTEFTEEIASISGLKTNTDFKYGVKNAANQLDPHLLK